MIKGGEPLKGLKVDTASSKEKQFRFGGKGGGLSQMENLTQKWQENKATMAKVCDSYQDMCYIMASATLTINTLAKDGAIKNKVSCNTSISILDKEDDDKLDTELNPEKVHKASSGSHLEKDETIQAPEQLSQYFMTVSCKWRLTSIIRFFKLNSEEKVFT